MPSKRRKSANSVLQAPMHHGRDYFSHLPLELLAEILSTTSPKDVLAVARCSKFLCNTLANNKSAEFIWRSARKLCKPYPLPDPTPNFTEASYAAFVFDHGNCEICNNFTTAPFHSFSMRLRLCRKPRCRNLLRNELIALELRPRRSNEYYAVRKWLPGGEEQGTHPNEAGDYWPLYYRKSDCEKATRDLEEFLANGGILEDYITKHAWDAKKRQIILHHSVGLVNWWRGREDLTKHIVDCNKRFARQRAVDHSWVVHDLFNSPTYQSLAKSSELRLEELTERDFSIHFSAIDTEVAEARERRLRRREEQLYAERRKAIEEAYRNLENKRRRSDWPLQLSVFRQLPVIKSLQDKMGMTKEQVLKQLDDVGVSKLSEMNIEAWKDQMEKRFSGVLGVPKKRFADPSKLKVIQRATARYLCKKCVPPECEPTKRAPTSLSFVEACRHRCPGLDKAQKKNATWRPEQFVADQKAIAVIRQALAQANKKEDQTKPGDLLVLGDVIRCKSCEGNIFLNYNTMVQHCHRHDAMEIEVLVGEVAVKKLQISIRHGYTEDLFSRRPGSRKRRERRVYGCRHCLKEGVFQDADGNVQQSSHTDSGNGGKRRCPPIQMLTFDGLRAHAKTRHGIMFIADEDYLVFKNDKGEL